MLAQHRDRGVERLEPLVRPGLDHAALHHCQHEHGEALQIVAAGEPIPRRYEVVLDGL